MVSRNLRFRFTLVSYNILSQTLLNDHGYLYANCNSRDLEWPRRGHRIVKELMTNQADIICLQEVESDHLQSLYRPRLAHYGYECLYKKKTGYKIDGCAIFFKSKLFNLLNHKGVEFNRTDLTYLLNRDNVGLIAVLQPRLSTRSKSSHLVIANTHLIFNPRRCDVKLAQLKFFLSQLEEISFDYYDKDKNENFHHPTILCGDLNSTPDSQVSKYILKEHISNHSNQNNTEAHRNFDHNRPMQSFAGNPHPINTGTPENSDLLRGLITDLNQLDIGQTEQLTSDRDELGLNVQHLPTKQQSNCHTTSTNNQENSRDKLLNESLRSNTSSSQIVDSGGGTSDCQRGQPNTIPLSRFEHSLQFKSAYPTHNRNGRKYVSTFSNDIVDYIFYTPAKLRLESIRELLTTSQLDEIGPLPNAEFPSDHLSLEAKFTLN